MNLHTQPTSGWTERLQNRLMVQHVKVRRVLRLFVMPGSGGVPFYDVLVMFFKSCFKGRLVDRAAAVAFNFFLALFPMVLFAFTLIPYLPVDNFQARLFEELNNILPPGTFDWVYHTIDDIMQQPHGGLMSVSILLSFIFGSSGVSAIFDGFKNVFLDIDSYSWLKQRINAVFMLIIIGACIFVAILLISFGGMGLTALMRHFEVERSLVFHVFNFFRWFIAVVFIMFSISLLYFFGNAEQKKYRFFSPGSCLATGLFIVATVGFNIYIANFSHYNALYGSIGAMIILMLWLWIISIIILCGNDLNASILRLSNAGRKS
ncbi:MAG: YihY/virulence factor BrkB family protein [Bacteroidales bacterium]|nr:YihY/virulence factor BrkB family protein [Bacteroidales bacterium]